MELTVRVNQKQYDGLTYRAEQHRIATSELYIQELVDQEARKGMTAIDEILTRKRLRVINRDAAIAAIVDAAITAGD